MKFKLYWEEFRYIEFILINKVKIYFIFKILVDKYMVVYLLEFWILKDSYVYYLFLLFKLIILVFLMGFIIVICKRYFGEIFIDVVGFIVYSFC